MIFNASSTHALRAMKRLAANPRTEAILGRDLAEEIEVPVHYLAKVLATLARAGLLTATRGTRGGYRLARRAEEIALVEIVEPFEGRRVRPGCLLRPDVPCGDDHACQAHGAWDGVKATYLRFLETTTLADIRGEADPEPGAITSRARAAARSPRSGRARPSSRARAARAPSR